MVYASFDVETYCKYDGSKELTDKLLIGLNKEDYWKRKKELKIGYYYPILDGTGKYFIAGSFASDNGKKKVFYDKNQMWNYIIEYGKKLRKNGKCLYLFGHNIKYDFYNIFQMDNHLILLSENPFIGIYSINEKKEIPPEKWENYKMYLKGMNKRYSFEILDNKIKLSIKQECIKFLDSMNLFKMSLKKVGELIGLEKLEMPKELKDLKSLKELETYVLRDSEIVLKGIEMLKKKLKNDGINVKRIMTINQLAIGYLLKKMREEKCDIFKSDKGDAIIQSKFRKRIRKAYRAGRVEVWKLGKSNNATYIDCNSLYPYSASRIKFPNLKTETFYNHPEKEYWEKLIKKIGISRVMLFNKNNEIGLIPSRQPTLSYIPKKNTYMIGTWTNLEIEKALQEGYKIINMQWSIIYEEMKNPFKEIMPKLYEKRKLDIEKKFDYNFYKTMMNNGIGKFTQIKTGQEITFDNIKKTEEYVKNNYQVLEGINEASLTMKFAKEPEKINYKKYYCPIITALITAEARIIMYNIFKKIGKDKLIYTDTDSCIFKGKAEDLKKIVKISNELGDFKIVQENDKFETYGRKSYLPADGLLRLSGVTKQAENKLNRETGIIKYTEMQGLKKKNTGEFQERERDLKKQVEDYANQEAMLREIKIFIDDDILKGIETNEDNISYFMNDIINAGIRSESMKMEVETKNI